MFNFGKIRHKNGSFFTNDIRLDRAKTIKIFGEDGTVMGLPFSIPSKEALISDQWRRGELEIDIFMWYLFQNGLRFLLLKFILKVLHDYKVAPLQLAPNAWRILGAFYIGCRILGIILTSRQC